MHDGSPPQSLAATSIRRRGRARRRRVLAWAEFVLLVLLGAWFLSRAIGRMGYNWQWYRVADYVLKDGPHGWEMGPLLMGLGVTLEITGVSLVLAAFIGLVTALLRLSSSWAGRVLARVYLELVRNTPLLIQLFFIYFVLSPVLGMEAFLSAVLALSLFEGAYASEIIRAGIVSVARGQWEAAHSLGLSGFQTYRHVILPQALRQILPPLASQAISLIKDSALVSTIAIYDLTMQGQAIVAETFLAFEIWFTVAGLYLVLTLTLSLLVRRLELRMGRAYR